MERLPAQVEAIEEWRARQIKLTRRVLRWLAVGLVLFAVANGWALVVLDNLVEDNARNIAAQNRVDQQLVLEAYQLDLTRWTTCNARNEIVREQLRQDKVQLTALIKAHTADGNRNAAKAWTNYLKRGQGTKLPPCGPEPTPPPVPQND